MTARARADVGPSLATHARRALVEAGVARGAGVLVACSGGVDSQVLLDTLAHVGASGRLRVEAHGVDHGLRPEAEAELALAADLAKARGVRFAVTRLRVEKGSNVQARAREARYRALRAAAAAVEVSLIATGHHLDDRAETVLIRLLRGAPLAGLGVLPVRTDDVLRPLIRARRADIVAHAETRALAFADDPSNVDRRYLRTRIRAEVLPLLRTLDPKIEAHLVALADEACGLRSDPETAVLAQGASRAALAALVEAERRRNPHARVELGGGRVGSWDALRGIVISPTNGSDAPVDPAPRRRRP